MGLDFSVTICSWNTLRDTRRCLLALQEAEGEANFETIVVDNNSQDGSPEMIESEFPGVKLIRSDINLGFTGGHNLAMKSRLGKDAFLLNSDAFIHSGTLSTLLEYRKANLDAGILGPKLLNEDGSLQLSCRKFPNPIAAIFRSTFLGKWFPKNRYSREYLMSDWGHDSIQKVDWLSGAAFYVTEETINKVGMFDESFFMYCEDVDLCFRAWESGFEVVYVPSAVVTHKIGTSSSKVVNKMIVRFHKSMFHFYEKHMISKKPLVLRPFILVLAALCLSVRAALFILKNWIDYCLKYLKIGTK